jgi:hypothetical protein
MRADLISGRRMSEPCVISNTCCCQWQAKRKLYVHYTSFVQICFAEQDVKHGVLAFTMQSQSEFLALSCLLPPPALVRKNSTPHKNKLNNDLR